MRPRRWIQLGVAAIAACLVALALPAVAASQFNFVVDTTRDGNDGECTNDCTVREALALADSGTGQWVQLPAGVYRVSQGPLVLQNDVIFGASFSGINSAGARTTVLDARGSGRVVLVPDGSSSVLAGLTLTGGSAANGAGVLVESSGQLSLYDTIVDGNVASARGGGIDGAGFVSLSYSTVSGNRVTAGSGGGIAVGAGSAFLFHSTVSGNRASANGGGITSGGSLQLQNTTVANNTAGFGGGLFQESTAEANTAMWSSILAGNQGGACGGSIAGLPRNVTSTNLADDATCAFAAGEGLNSVNPLLRPLANYRGPTDTHALGAGSPAIDAADGTLCPGGSVDQRHAVVVGRCDIGAFEFGGRPPEPQLPPPVPGETVNASRSRGTVKVKLPGSDEFFTLQDGQQVPVGTTFDTSKGRVTLVAAANNVGSTQKAWFYSGVFKVGQSKGRKPLTTLTLAGKLSCGSGKAGSAAKKKRKRRLWGDGKGRFRTRGVFSAATVRGTRWLTEDRCNGTLTRVKKGRVSVRDFGAKRTVIVRAGRSYLARRK